MRAFQKPFFIFFYLQTPDFWTILHWRKVLVCSQSKTLLKHLFISSQMRSELCNSGDCVEKLCPALRGSRGTSHLSSLGFSSITPSSLSQVIEVPPSSGSWWGFTLLWALGSSHSLWCQSTARVVMMESGDQVTSLGLRSLATPPLQSSIQSGTSQTGPGQFFRACQRQKAETVMSTFTPAKSCQGGYELSERKLLI